MKPYKRIFVSSVVLTIIIYLFDIYVLDPIAPVPGWRYRIFNFTECLILYSAGFFVIFSFVYICYDAIKKFVTGKLHGAHKPSA